MRTLGVLLAVLLAGPVHVALAATPEETREHCTDWVEQRIELRHIPRDEIDGADICARFAAAVADGLPRVRWGPWMHREMIDAEFRFAPKGARHAAGARYRFPYQPWIPRLAGQGPGGETHDTPEDHFAYDFLMPRGALVQAAREGTVAAVRDGSTARNVTERSGDSGNAVMVLHEDGTFALYAHLEPGIPVKRGQKVKRGTVLGLAGNTGFAKGSHLHFVVRARNAEGDLISVPVRFGRPGTPGQEIQVGQHYGRIPTGKRRLAVRVDGVEANNGSPMTVREGDTLAVEVRMGGTDVTGSDRLRFETMTLWSLDGTEAPRLRVRPDPSVPTEFVLESIPDKNRSEGLLFVYHGEPWDTDFGLFQLRFTIEKGS